MDLAIVVKAHEDARGFTPSTEWQTWFSGLTLERQDYEMNMICTDLQKKREMEKAQ